MHGDEFEEPSSKKKKIIIILAIILCTAVLIGATIFLFQVIGGKESAPVNQGTSENAEDQKTEDDSQAENVPEPDTDDDEQAENASKPDTGDDRAEHAQDPGTSGGDDQGTGNNTGVQGGGGSTGNTDSESNTDNPGAGGNTGNTDSESSTDNPGAGESTGSSTEAGMKFQEVNETVTAKDVTNLRNIPSQGTDSTVLRQLTNGETATRTGVSDSGWSRLVLDGTTYYAVSNYLTTDLSFRREKPEAEEDDGIKTKFTACQEQVTPKIEINLRNIPSVTNPDAVVVATAYAGEIFLRTGINTDVGWSRVEYNGQVLYCVSSYLNVVE